MEERFDVVSYFSDSSHLLVWCGAGLSAGSGIPTYRGLGSSCYDGNVVPSREDDLERLRSLSAAKPNHAHNGIASMQWKLPLVSVVTTNVDGLLQKAGCLGVVELHGSFNKWRCDACFRPTPVAAEACSRCGKRARPDVVRFGECLDPRDAIAAKKAAAACDAVLAIGTSGVVWPANDILASALAKAKISLEVNPEETELSSLFDARVSLPAEKLFKE